MKLTTITTLLLIGAASSAHARLGETVEICAERYGEPVTLKMDEQKTGVAVYDKNDLTIKLHFSKGTADLIRYSPGIVQQIDLEIARELLTRNGRDKEWTQLTETEQVIYDVRDEHAQHPRVEMVDPILWQSKDKMLKATYSDSTKTFEISAETIEEKILKGL